MKLQPFMKTILHVFYCCCFLIHFLLSISLGFLKKTNLFFFGVGVALCAKKNVYLPPKVITNITIINTMDLKKSKNANLEDKKLTFLLLGLVIALGISFIALEWTKTEVTKYEVADEEFLVEEEIEIIQTQQEQQTPPPPPPPVQKPEEIILEIVDDKTETQTIEINTEDDQKQEIVIAPPVAAPEPEEEEDNTVFMVVEQMPEFPGGATELFKYLSQNIRYPVIAQENGIQGRVICQFTVNRDGSVVDVRVVRSSGDASLDKEAIRVINTMPKWTPGKQRGKAVRVNYTLPVTFRLQ